MEEERAVEVDLAKRLIEDMNRVLVFDDDDLDKVTLEDFNSSFAPESRTPTWDNPEGVSPADSTTLQAASLLWSIPHNSQDVSPMGRVNPQGTSSLWSAPQHSEATSPAGSVNLQGTSLLWSAPQNSQAASPTESVALQGTSMLWPAPQPSENTSPVGSMTLQGAGLLWPAAQHSHTASPADSTVMQGTSLLWSAPQVCENNFSHLVNLTFELLILCNRFKFTPVLSYHIVKIACSHYFCNILKPILCLIFY